MEKVALVTGCSSGIGYETAIALARNGYYTFAGIRDLKKAVNLEKVIQAEKIPIKILKMDVDDEESVKKAFEEIVSSKNRLDVLVNNAGWGIFGCVEDVSIKEFKDQFETNFFSIIRLIQLVAPIMRKQGSGYIVNISSVAGRIGFPASPAYISSKFALEGLSESLRYELDQFGVKVVIIEPGAINTNFFKTLKLAEPKKDSPYKEITQKVFQGVKMMGEFGTKPEEVAKTIIKAISEKTPLPRYIVGTDAQMFLEAKKAKSDIEFENYLKKELFS